MSTLTRLGRTRSRGGRVAAALGICVLPAAAVVSGGVAAAAANGTVTLVNEVVPGLSAMSSSPVAGDPTMTVGVGMKTDSAAKTAAYQALFTPGSPNYHQWYTPASFDAAFGVSQAQAQNVRAWATREGLKVIFSNADGSYLELSGTTSQVDSTFSVTEKNYLNTGAATSLVAAGQAFLANDKAPTVPATVSGVSGLNSLMAYSTAKRSAPAATASATETCTSTSGLCVGALTPTDLRSVYGVPSTDLGAGQKVAVFGEGKLSDVVSDLRVFEKDFSMPQVPVKEILVGDDLSDDSGAGEWDLDSQASTGMAPNMQELDFYFGEALSDQSITATYYAWDDDANGPLTGNSSFGGSEQVEELDGFLADPALQEADMEGRTMFVSAGDVGSSCLPGANGATNTGAPCVEYPGSSPYVNAVGGTVLYTAATATGNNEVSPATRAREYAWTYSGGGTSDFEVAPSWEPGAWPVAGSTTGSDVPAVCQAAGNCTRGVPDVSALSGDIVTNGYVWVNNGTLGQEGGTSLSSPLWAGMWANVQAAFKPKTACAAIGDVTAESATATSPGFAPPLLYAIAANTTADLASFFNVGGTSNSVEGAGNGAQTTNIRMSPTDPTGYSFVSGLGTPMLGGIINNIDCGNATAVNADVTEPIGPTVYVYGQDAPYDNLSADGCGPNGYATHGSTTQPTAVGPLSLVSAKLTSDATSTTFSTTASTLTGSATTDYDYAFEFVYGGGYYAVTVDTGASPVAELYSLGITGTPTGVGVQAAPTALATLTPVVNTAANTVSVIMPFATFNANSGSPSSYGPGAHLNGVSVFSNTGPATTALADDFNVDPADQVDFFQCPYIVPGAVAAALPEAPYAALLPLLGLTLAGAYLLRRRSKA